jgi:hypothetical protein
MERGVAMEEKPTKKRVKEKKRVKDMTPEERKAHQAKLRAERKAWYREYKDQWKAKVLEYFSYLETDYGFRITKIPMLGPWYISVRFQSRALAVEVRRSVEFNAVELWLIRLVGRSVPDYPVFIYKDTPIYWYLLDGIVEKRAPEEAEKFETLRGLSDEQIEHTLAFLAHALQTYAVDVLHGDFTILDTLADDLHNRVPERPKQRTIYCSPFMSDEKFADTVEFHDERNKNAPPEEQVIVRRFTMEEWKEYTRPRVPRQSG